MGHRLLGHEGKCRHLHGHNYVGLFTAQVDLNQVARPEGLDSLGRVVDFSVLKTRIGDWIEKFWDHGFVLYDQDLVAKALIDDLIRKQQSSGQAVQKVSYIPSNPTAENLAQFLLRTVCPEVLMGVPVRVIHVRIWETENCHADANL